MTCFGILCKALFPEFDVTGPLQGLRVLDLTRILAGPWATQMLADFGADVIKIEKPGEGDDTRGWGPPFVVNADGTTGDAAYFQAANRGKHSVCIDMSLPDGQVLLRQLAAQSDIVIENFKVGGLKKYGLDYDSLKASNPRLIYCSITGFGQTGPFAQRAGYDFMIQGMSGVMSITGEAGGDPMKVGVAFSDVFAGLHAVIGIQAALLHREKTGQGQHVDISLLDSQVSVLANQALNYLVGGKVPQRLGNAHPNIVPYQTFETKDGHMIIAVGNDRQYAEFCAIIGAAHLVADPYRSNRGRVEHRDALIALLIPYLKTRSAADWMQAFEAAAVPCGPINTIDQVFENPQIKARQMQVNLQGDDGVTVPGLANPIVFSETPNTYKSPSPKLGGGTDTVLSSLLGLSPEALEKLRLSGVIA
jgi:crotonobetainyl-CoA:carnitine CoA-transferase CaiB-like acyl-CoA transferase